MAAVPRKTVQDEFHSHAPLTRLEQLRYAREVVAAEGQALVELSQRIDTRLLDAAAIIAEMEGCLVATGVGKAGLIAQKLVATFSSTGNRAHFLHPSEAIHGDLGRVGSTDVVLVLSYSGRSEEIVRLLPALREQSKHLLAITATTTSPLGKAADLVLEVGRISEACSLGLAPSTTTTAMLAMGDALALLASRLRGFTSADFAKYHPGGSLGAQLSTVDDHMRATDQCRIAEEDESVREMLVRSAKTGRRTGAVLLVDKAGKLSGIFTDSDLAKLLERRRDAALDSPARSVMTHSPRTVRSGTMLSEAVLLLAKHHLSELPVVDELNRPQGVLDVTDIVGLVDIPTSIPCPPTGNWPNRSA